MESDTTQQKPSKNIKKIIIYILIVIIIAAITGGGVYWWENKQLEKQKTDLQGQINTSKASISKLEADKKTLEEQIQKATPINQLSDAQLILTAKNHYFAIALVKVVNVEIRDKEGDFALLEVNLNEPGTDRLAIFKKVNNTWQYIWEGTQAPSSIEIQTFGIPQGLYK